MAAPTDLVERSRRPNHRAKFDRRVDEQVERLRGQLEAGRFDNPEFGIGLEVEAYAVDDAGRLARLPGDVFDGLDGCARELGRHNVEFNTAPTPFDGDGIESQAIQLRRLYRDFQRGARASGLEVVLDAMWAVPPAEGTRAYLSDVEDRDGVAIATNMTPDPRYWAIDDEVVSRASGSITLSVPGVACSFPSILFESLTSSIQPHLQLPRVDLFPRYHALAIRTLGPVLALATNSPLLPADLYEADDPYAILEDTAHELRVPVFEQSVNRSWQKVRVPQDVDSAGDSLERLREDPTCAPFLREWLDAGDRETVHDRYWELDHKRGTYWRWLRPVFGGRPVGDGDRRSIRLEYRPLPTQPTVADNVGFLCLVAGLLTGLAATDHPLPSLEWTAAERCFYDVVADGLAADLAWITADGERTDDPSIVYDELFSLARRGLREMGVDATVADRYLGPIEARWERSLTPSRWKLDRVRDGLERGLGFEAAVEEMQAAYVRRAGTQESFAEWPGV